MGQQYQRGDAALRARVGVLTLALVLGSAACSSESAETAPNPIAGAPQETIPNEPIGPIHFRNAAARLGNLLQPGGRGVALTDIDQDGWPDVTVLAQNEVLLFRGVGDGLFLPFGPPIEFDFGQAATWADVDGDGDLDLYVSSAYERHGLFLNDGDGNLSEATDAAGLGEVMPVGGQGATFGDVDGDGDLDLYLCFAAPPHDRVPDPPPEFGSGGAPNRLYLNDGAGHFVRGDDSVIGGIPTGESFIGVLFDADDDSDLDLFVVHDGERDEYFENQGGTFVDRGADRLPGGGAEQTSIMGIDIADYDGDGDLDLYGTQRERDILYLAHDGRWTNAWPQRMRGYDPTAQITGWGVALTDIDNDGDLDQLGTSNYETIFDFDNGGPGGYRTGWLTVLRSDGDGEARGFTDVSEEAGSIFNFPIDGFGLAVADIDRDGDPDAVIGIDGTGDKADPDATQHTLVLINDGSASKDNGWLVLTVRQPGPNPFAVGAVVDILGLGIQTRRPILAGASYLSSQADRLHFGLGHHTHAVGVRVRWPDGATTLWTNLATGEHALERPPDGATCCTATGCDHASEPECLARETSASSPRCESICAQLESCCGAHSGCMAACLDRPPPEWTNLCLTSTGCNSVYDCLGRGRYAVPTACVIETRQ